MFYLLLAIFLFIGALVYAYNEKPLGKKAKLTLFFCFWLIAGLAWQTGVDWRVYERIFAQVHPLNEYLSTGIFYDDIVGAEPLYTLLSSTIKLFTNEFQILHIVTLLIATIFFFKALSKYTQNYFAVLLLYLGYVYLTLNMSGIRQAAALAIIFYSLQFTESKQFWRFAFYVILATLFHYSALIILPLYWMINKTIPTKVLLIVIGSGLVIYVTRIAVISETIEKVSEAAGNHVMFRLYLYITRAEETLPSISLKMLLHTALFVMLLFRRNALLKKSKYANIFINLFALYIIIGQYMWDTGDIVIRLQHYFIMGLVVVLPLYMETLKYRGNKLILTCFIFCLSVWSSNPIFLEKPNGLPYNPYQNYILYQLTGQQSTGDERLSRWRSSGD